MSISIPIPLQSLSAAKSLWGCAQSVTLPTKFSHLSITSPGVIPFKAVPIQMGGGPRTYPGGVSKWQWKRMQAKKAKQLLKARLARERQIYEMRKRAELKAAVSELERPWEVVEKPPTLFSVSADEQLKVLADRFQKPGGLDLWSERDGPELFRPDSGLPSMRFFPKGVVHSVKPYGKSERITTTPDELPSHGLEEDLVPRPVSVRKMGPERKGSRKNLSGNHGSSSKGENVNNGDKFRSSSEGVAKEGGKVRKKSGRSKYLGDIEGQGMRSWNDGLNNRKERRGLRPGGGNAEFRSISGEKMDSQVFDMSLQNDGAYGFELED